jgi:hypothetical protein
LSHVQLEARNSSKGMAAELAKLQKRARVTNETHVAERKTIVAKAKAEREAMVAKAKAERTKEAASKAELQRKLAELETEHRTLAVETARLRKASQPKKGDQRKLERKQDSSDKPVGSERASREHERERFELETEVAATAAAWAVDRVASQLVQTALWVRMFVATPPSPPGGGATATSTLCTASTARPLTATVGHGATAAHPYSRTSVSRADAVAIAQKLGVSISAAAGTATISEIGGGNGNVAPSADTATDVGHGANADTAATLGAGRRGTYTATAADDTMKQLRAERERHALTQQKLDAVETMMETIVTLSSPPSSPSLGDRPTGGAPTDFGAATATSVGGAGRDRDSSSGSAPAVVAARVRAGAGQAEHRIQMESLALPAQHGSRILELEAEAKELLQDRQTIADTAQSVIDTIRRGLNAEHSAHTATLLELARVTKEHKLAADENALGHAHRTLLEQDFKKLGKTTKKLDSKLEHLADELRVADERTERMRRTLASEKKKHAATRRKLTTLRTRTDLKLAAAGCVAKGAVSSTSTGLASSPKSGRSKLGADSGNGSAVPRSSSAGRAMPAPSPASSARAKKTKSGASAVKSSGYGPARTTRRSRAKAAGKRELEAGVGTDADAEPLAAAAAVRAGSHTIRSMDPNVRNMDPVESLKSLEAAIEIVTSRVRLIEGHADNTATASDPASNNATDDGSSDGGDGGGGDTSTDTGTDDDSDGGSDHHDELGSTVTISDEGGSLAPTLKGTAAAGPTVAAPPEATEGGSLAPPEATEGGSLAPSEATAPPTETPPRSTGSSKQKSGLFKRRSEETKGGSSGGGSGGGGGGGGTPRSKRAKPAKMPTPTAATLREALGVTRGRLAEGRRALATLTARLDREETAHAATQLNVLTTRQKLTAASERMVALLQTVQKKVEENDALARALAAAEADRDGLASSLELATAKAAAEVAATKPQPRSRGSTVASRAREEAATAARAEAAARAAATAAAAAAAAKPGWHTYDHLRSNDGGGTGGGGSSSARARASAKKTRQKSMKQHTPSSNQPSALATGRSTGKGGSQTGGKRSQTTSPKRNRSARTAPRTPSRSSGAGDHSAGDGGGGGGGAPVAETPPKFKGRDWSVEDALGDFDGYLNHYRATFNPDARPSPRTKLHNNNITPGRPDRLNLTFEPRVDVDLGASQVYGRDGLGGSGGGGGGGGGGAGGGRTPSSAAAEGNAQDSRWPSHDAVPLVYATVATSTSPPALHPSTATRTASAKSLPVR